MSDPIDLSAARNRRTGPDAEHVQRDDFGRPMYRYLLSYEMGSDEWGAEVWAYSMEDAANRVAAMRSSLILKGQAMRCERWP